MLITLEQAREYLHLDPGAVDNEILAYIAALPGYIEDKTGLAENEQIDHPLITILCKYLLLRWYHGADPAVDRVCDSLIMHIGIVHEVRGY